MKRMHFHVSVGDLGESIRFYSAVFGAAPSVVKADYAKWMLDDPRMNFAISQRGVAPGVDHVGIQVDDRVELAELADRLKAAGQSTFDQEATTCCYARSDKSWVSDPSGLRWETFFTFGDATTYGEDAAAQVKARQSAGCCGSESAAQPAKACCG